MENRNSALTFTVLITDRQFSFATMQPYWLDGMTVKGRVLANDTQLTETQNQIVKLCAECEDNILLKKFSGNDVTIMNMMKKFEKAPQTAELFWTYLSKRYGQAVQLLTTIPDTNVYFRKANTGLVYESDKITICPATVHPAYLFKLTENGLDYKFRFTANGEIVWLKYRNHLLSLSQALPYPFVLNNQLCVCERVGYKAVSAIAKNGSIHVPTDKAPVYLNTFVKKVLQTEDATCEGIDVFTTKEALTAKLILTTDTFGKSALKLAFHYGEHSYSFASEQRHDVVLEEKEGKFAFHISKRDFKKENRLLQQLNEHSVYSNGDFLYLNNKNGTLQELIELPEIKENFEVVKEFTLTTFAEEKEDWFDVKMTVCIREFKIPFSKFRHCILKKETSYQLPDGSTFYLPEEWFSSYAELFDKAEVEGDAIKLHKRFSGLIADQCPAAKAYLSNLTSKERPIPVRLNATLRNYQTEGFNYLVNLYENNYGGCLADDMGLGKTLQFIAFLVHIYNGTKRQWTKDEHKAWQYHSSEPSLFDQVLDEEPAPVSSEKEGTFKPASIVVVPTTVLFNWEKELEKFAPSLHYTTFYGSKRLTLIGPHTFDNYNLVLTTYSILTRDAEKLSHYNFECAILDESQNIKNPQSQNHASAKLLKARCHFAVTGTPIENSLNDLWAQMSFACPGLLGSFRSFSQNYTAENPERIEILKKTVSPYILRRTKEQVCPDLPELTQTNVWCEMDEKTERAYEAEKSAARNAILRIGPGNNAIHILQQLMRLRQLACDPSLLEDYKTLTSSKRKAVVEQAYELHQSGHKILLFSAFVGQLNLIAEDLKAQGIPYDSLTGADTSKERQSVVERFQKDPKLTCLLVSLKAGSTGINLTAANYVFLLSPWWNPFVEQQAIDRAYRIGQQNNVTVYNFITKDTVEEKILRLQERKRQLSDSIISAENPLLHLSAEELEELV